MRRRVIHLFVSCLAVAVETRRGHRARKHVAVDGLGEFEPVTCIGIILPHVQRGELAAARQMAAEYASAKASTGPLSWAQPSTQPVGLDADRAKECANAWKVAMDELLALPDHLALIRRAAAEDARPPKPVAPSAHRCPAAFDAKWEQCCSSLSDDADANADCIQLPADGPESELGAMDDGGGANGTVGKLDLPAAATDGVGGVGIDAPCCAFANGSRAFLRIPALREVRVAMRLASGAILRLTQDGFVRPFDVSSVLWPAGYLLAQWVSAVACADESLRGARVLELGAGVGAASLAAALCVDHAAGGRVLSTDRAAHSVAIVAANAALNGLDDAVTTATLDWDDDAALAQAAAAHGPFDLVLGAALQFETWQGRLAGVLAALLKPGGRAVLAHTIGGLASLPAGGVLWEEARTPALAFGMHTAHSREASDFEVVLLRRKRS